MSNGSNFVSSYSFTLPDEILRQLRAFDFISGTSTGPVRTKALVEGALAPLAKEASRKEAQSRQFALEERGLDLQEKNLASLEEFRQGELALQDRRLDELRKQQKQELFKGFGQLAGLAFLMPGGKSTTTIKGGVTTTLTPTLGTKTWEVAKKAWNLMFS